MELIDRYLQAVKFWLPRDQKDDIARELSEDIRSEVEQAESETGRPMTPAEIESLLKRRGRPFVVANHYLPQRQLIGPLLYPAWAFVLKLIGLVYVLPWIIVWMVLLMLAPSYRGHLDRDVAALWNMLVHIFAVVTILFAVGEHYAAAPDALPDWDPRRLPRLRARGRERISRASSVAEIVFNLTFGTWWIGGFPVVYGRDVNPGTIWPEFHRMFFIPVIVLVVIAIANAVMSVIRPYWTRPRLLVRAFVNAAMAAIAAWSVVTWGPTVRTAFFGATHVQATGAPPWAVGPIVDGGVLVALVVVTVICTITLVRETYRAATLRQQGES